MKNKIKIAVTVILTIWVQFEAVKENGYWGIGGNALVPILCWLLFWIFPNLIRELKKEFK
jgi:hypothetical protein